MDSPSGSEHTESTSGSLARRSSLPAPQAYELEDPHSPKTTSTQPMPVSLSSIFAPVGSTSNVTSGSIPKELEHHPIRTILLEDDGSSGEESKICKELPPTIHADIKQQAQKEEIPPNIPSSSSHPILPQDVLKDDLDLPPVGDKNCCSRCLFWFWKDVSLIAKGLRLFIFITIILLPGILLHFLWPTVKIDHDSPLFWTGIGSFILLGYPVLIYLINVLVYFCHKYEVSWLGVIFYISECKRHVAILLYLVLFTAIWNATPLYDTEIWRGHRAVVNKVVFALAISTLTFAYKRHLVNKLSLGFNYTNYRDRIKDCLFADDMIHALQKSKMIYKTRRKAQKLTPIQKSRPHLSSSPPPFSPAYLTINPRLMDPGKRWTHMMKSGPDAKLSSDIAIDILPTESTSTIVSTYSGTDDVASCRSSSPLHEESPLPRQTEAQATVPSDEVLDPVHFQMEMSCFQKLLVRILDQFHATKSTIYQQGGRELASSEIRSEARELAKKLYKWILPVDPLRSVIIKQDLVCVIDDPIALNRLWGMLCITGDHPSHEQTQRTIDSGSTDKKFYSIPVAATSNGTTTQPTPPHHRRLASLATSSPLPNQLPRSPPTPIQTKELSIQFFDLADFIERTWMEIIGIAKSLNSMEAAVNKLDVFFSIICIVILLLFLALFFGDFLTSLTSITTILLSFSFIFTESARNFFESVIFLFVTHPFDVGDRVYLSVNPTTGPTPPIALPAGGIQLTNSSPGSGPLENMIVLEMNLITTLFERWDGARIYIPNYILARRPIINIRRSGALYEVHRLQFSFSTPVSKLNELRKRIEYFLKKESSDYTEELLMNVEMIENLNRMHFLIMVQHRTNWQDFESQLARKSKILMFLKDTVEALGIEYSPPIQRLEVLTVSSK